MLLAEAAVFAEFHAIRGVLLVLHGIVIALLAFGASQADLVTGNACHVLHLL